MRKTINKTLKKLRKMTLTEKLMFVGVSILMIPGVKVGIVYGMYELFTQ